MKKILMCCLLGVCFANFLLAETPLKETVASDEVVAVLEPDGVAIKQFDDGTFQIFARGTGVYDFNDPEDVLDARNEAILKAKANLAKFMEETLSTEEGFSKASKKTSNKSKNGEEESSSISKETVTMSSTIIKTQASALLKGVITLKEEKIPSGNSSGTVQVTVGVSSKTLSVASALKSKIENPQETQKQETNNAKASLPNEYEVRKANTDF